MKQSGEQVDVKLPKPMPVYFVYISAWATPDGVVNFRPDIYNHDGAARDRLELTRLQPSFTGILR